MSNKPNSLAPVWAVIPAAGVGQRMQSAIPKQYLPLLGSTVLEQTLGVFLACPLVQGVVVVTGADDAYWPAIASRFADQPVHQTVGGRDRAGSVLNGLDYLAGTLQLAGDTAVLVHDAARPCLTQQDLLALLAVREEALTSGALLASPVRDTMKRAQSGNQRVAYTEDREDLWHALTPQMASLDILRRALRAGIGAGATITDEASALESVGLKPLLVEGDARNIKITRPADLALAEMFLSTRGRS